MLSVRSVTKRFGQTVAVDDVSLDVADDTVAILGPSGCGKSTLLRLIAGLEPPDHGTVNWDGEDITNTPVHLRDFGLMFQTFALFPHRTVGQNVAFGLQMHDVKPDEQRRRVDEALAWVGMEEFNDRRVDGLSGGEKQRVALARTLAPRPRLVMLDEPLGSLDRLIRDRLIEDIDRLLDDTATPAIYVTHDHEEAQTIANRIAVMRAGRIVQIGTWQELTSHPEDEWVERFLGV